VKLRFLVEMENVMSCWLSQMRNGERITVDYYVKEVWEGEEYEWHTFRVLSPLRSKPKSGDIIILFFLGNL
jgi:LEA14-like dessication related protein